jgi:hypothetical protein
MIQQPATTRLMEVEEVSLVPLRLRPDGKLFVKYGDNDLLDEANDQLASPSSAPRIPAVYNTFPEQGYYFIVVEKVDMLPWRASNFFSEKYAVQYVASVKWLLDQMPSIPLVGFRTGRRVSGSPFFHGHRSRST